MTFYTASFETVTLRFVLMMAVVIAAFVSGYPILGIIGLPIFLSAMMGVSIKSNQKKAQTISLARKNTTPDMENQAA